MKLFFGVQATGNGHISASRLIVSALKAAGHSVTVLFSGQGRAPFWSMAEFEPFSERRGLTFVVENGSINYIKTAMQLRPGELIRDIRQLDLQGYDAVISNFEPISAWAAKFQRIPSIGISHQAAFYYDAPKQPGNYFARAVLRYFAPTTHQLGMHWHHFGQPIIPPVIEPGLRVDGPVDPQTILVCLPFENREEVLQRLLPFTDYRFLFHTDVQEVQQHGHVQMLPFSREPFMANLKRSAGVICHAGFELPSETLHLGKKLLVKPIQGQYEQMCNAMAVQQHQLGRVMRRWDSGLISEFLSAQAPAPKNYPNVAQAIAHWIGQADLLSPRAHMPLVQQLWQGAHA